MFCQPSFSAVQRAQMTTDELLFYADDMVYRFNLSTQALKTDELSFPVDALVCIGDSVVLASEKVYVRQAGEEDALEQLCQQYDPKEGADIFAQDGKLFVIQAQEVYRFSADMKMEHKMHSDKLGKVIDVSGIDDLTLIHNQEGYVLFKGSSEIPMPEYTGFQRLYLLQGHMVLINQFEIVKISLADRKVVNKVTFDAEILAQSKFQRLLAAGVGDDVVLFDLDAFKAVFKVKRQNKLFDAYQIAQQQTIRHVHIQNQHILVVQGPIAFVINYAKEPEITSHFLLVPEEWEEFGVTGQHFCFTKDGRGLFFGANLNIFNGRGYDDGLRVSGTNYIVQQGNVYQVQQNRLTQVRSFEGAVTGIVKLQDSTLALLMNEMLYHLDAAGKVLQYFKSTAVEVGRYQKLVWLRNSDCVEFYTAKDFKPVKKLSFPGVVNQVLSHPSQIYFLVRQAAVLQLFTYQNDSWFECGKADLEFAADIQMDSYGLFLFESDLHRVLVRRFMDLKLIKTLQVEGVVRVTDFVFVNGENGIMRYNLAEVDAVRNDCRRRFVQDVAEFWAEVELVKWK